MDEDEIARAATRSKEDLIDYLAAKASLADRRDELERLVTPTLGFLPLEQEDSVPGGQNMQFGGLPKLPANLDWPWRAPLPQYNAFKNYLTRGGDEDVFEAWQATWPLTFIADVDLATAKAAFPGDWPLPSDGRFLFFWDLLCGAWRSKETNRVIWDRSDRHKCAEVDIRSDPRFERYIELADGEANLPRTYMEPAVRWLIPTHDWRQIEFGHEHWSLTDEIYDCFEQYITAGALDFDLSGHQFLGHPTPFQSDPICDAFQVHTGTLDIPILWGDIDDRRNWGEAPKWMLLLQFDLGGRGAGVFFYVQKEKAKAGDFSEVISIYQQ